MPHKSRMIAIASGKGGVGKTWFAITLAHALSQRGRRVLLIDGDLGLANIDVQLGLTSTHDLGAVLDGRASLSQAMTRSETADFDILPGCSGSGARAMTDPARLDAVLAMVSGTHDDVLLDLGAGVERTARRLAAAADVLLVLATEEPTSLTDAYAVVKLYRADIPSGTAQFVINMASSSANGERTYATLRRACATFLRYEPALAGVIRRDDKVRDAIRRQTPLLTRHPGCVAAQDVEAIARNLAPAAMKP